MAYGLYWSADKIYVNKDSPVEMTAAMLGSGDPGTAEASVEATTTGWAGMYQTVLEVTALAMTIGNTTGISFGGEKLFTFPEGRILVHGVTIEVQALGLANAGNATPIVGTMGGDFGLGTTVAGDGTITATDVNFCPSTSWDPFTGTPGAALAVAAQFDGTTTAIPLFFNMLIDDADVANGASDVLELTAVVTITWSDLGNYD